MSVTPKDRDWETRGRQVFMVVVLSEPRCVMGLCSGYERRPITAQEPVFLVETPRYSVYAKPIRLIDRYVREYFAGHGLGYSRKHGFLAE